jgi:IS1 family transposase
LYPEGNLAVRLELACEAAEMNEQWSFIGKKSNQRWLWYAVDHATNTVLAYVFGKHQDVVFKELKALLEPFGISLIIPMIGTLMSAILKAISTRSANITPKRLNAKT